MTDGGNTTEQSYLYTDVTGWQTPTMPRAKSININHKVTQYGIYNMESHYQQHSIMICNVNHDK